MSRALTSIVAAYKNMDIENMPSMSTEQKPSSGLLVKKDKVTDGLDYSNPAVRVATQMRIIRNYRDEINAKK